jgi:hypothetical protein
LTPRVPEPGWARSLKFCQIRIPHSKITLNRHPYCWNHSYKWLAPRVPEPGWARSLKFFECSTLHDLQNRLQKTGSLYLFPILRSQRFQPASQPASQPACQPASQTESISAFCIYKKCAKKPLIKLQSPEFQPQSKSHTWAPTPLVHEKSLKNQIM